MGGCVTRRWGRTVGGAYTSSIQFVGSGLCQALTANVPTDYNFSSLKDASNSTPTLLENDFVFIHLASACTSTGNMTIPSGYTEIQSQFIDHTGVDTYQRTCYKFMGASPDTLVTLPGKFLSTDAASATCHVFRGVNLSNPIDVSAVLSSINDSTIPDPGAITPASIGSMLVVCCAGGSSSAANYTVPADLSNGTNHFRAQTINDTRDLVIGAGFQGTVPLGTGGPFNPVVFGGGTSAAGETGSATVIALRPA